MHGVQFWGIGNSGCKMRRDAKIKVKRGFTMVRQYVVSDYSVNDKTGEYEATFVPYDGSNGTPLWVTIGPRREAP